MTISGFRIVLDRQSETYFSGGVVSGTLHFTLAKEKKIKGVTLKFQGDGLSKCIQTQQRYENGQNRTVQTTHILTETYMDHTVYLAGGQGELILPPGDHSYPFKYILPVTLPSSFEGDCGFVRYVIRCALERPWRFDHKCKRAFTIICPLDLNLIPGLQEPIKAADEKVLCCGCCASAPITLAAVLPYRGFVPGQRTNAIIEVDNPTTSIVSVKCNLIQHVTYYAPNRMPFETQKVVAKEKMGSAEKKGSLSQQSLLRIPPLPASAMPFCNVLIVSYTLQILGEISGAHGPATLNIPITIGTIPLLSSIPLIVVTVSRSEEDPGSPEAQQGDPFRQYPQIPPPSYEESVSGKVNIRSKDDDNYVQGNLEYAPRYPMYNFQ